MPPYVIDALTHGGSIAMITLLAWLWSRERAERVAANALVLQLTRELVTASSAMVQATHANTRATSEMASHIEGLGDKLDSLLSKGARGR